MLCRLLIAVLMAVLTPIAFAAAGQPRMDQIVQHYVNNDEFMGAVLVAEGDRVLFSKAYGSADLEWNVPNTLATRFRIGSVTKQFTAVCILLLEERGKLKLEDPIRKYYPEAPASWGKVTLLHLLHHTSGIHSYTDDPKFETFTKLPATPAEIVRRVHDKPLGFEPGREHRYSNTGYILLGLVIEKVSGKTYAEFLKTQVLEPLGLKDSGYDVNTEILARRATGYAKSPAGLVNSQYIDMTIPYAAGAMYSTVGDLLRWQRGLYGKKLLSAASLGKFTTVGLKDYALGVSVRKFAGKDVIRHGGSINGFSSNLLWFPQTQTTVVALSNLIGPGADSIVNTLGALVHGGDVEVPKDILEKYVGTYEVRPSFNMWFVVRDGRLFSQATGQQDFPLFAKSKIRFAPLAFEAELEFQFDANGKVAGVMLYQNGTKTMAKRVSDSRPAP